MFAYELQGTNILVNSVCPGWVKTDMGGQMHLGLLSKGLILLFGWQLCRMMGRRGDFSGRERRSPGKINCHCLKWKIFVFFFIIPIEQSQLTSEVNEFL
jgi:hypothetical protein